MTGASTAAAGAEVGVDGCSALCHSESPPPPAPPACAVAAVGRCDGCDVRGGGCTAAPSSRVRLPSSLPCCCAAAAARAVGAAAHGVAADTNATAAVHAVVAVAAVVAAEATAQAQAASGHTAADAYHRHHSRGARRVAAVGLGGTPDASRGVAPDTASSPGGGDQAAAHARYTRTRAAAAAAQDGGARGRRIDTRALHAAAVAECPYGPHDAAAAAAGRHCTLAAVRHAAAVAAVAGTVCMCVLLL